MPGMGSLPSTHVAEVGPVRVQFFNFCEYPVEPGQAAHPTLYMNIGVRYGEGHSFIFYNVRLAQGQFVNPYYRSGPATKAAGYVGPETAKAIATAWEMGPASLTGRWPLLEGADAWKRLCFDVERMSALTKKPYAIFEAKKARKKKVATGGLEI